MSQRVEIADRWPVLDAADLCLGESEPVPEEFLRDAVAAIAKPMVEVHLSDITKREEFRRHSVFDGLPNVRIIMGRGVQGYVNALRLLVDAQNTVL